MKNFSLFDCQLVDLLQGGLKLRVSKWNVMGEIRDLINEDLHLRANLNEHFWRVHSPMDFVLEFPN